MTWELPPDFTGSCESGRQPSCGQGKPAGHDGRAKHRSVGVTGQQWRGAQITQRLNQEGNGEKHVAH